MPLSTARKIIVPLAGAAGYIAMIIVLAMPVGISVAGGTLHVTATKAHAQAKPPTTNPPAVTPATPPAPAPTDPSSATDHLFNPIKYTVLADLIIGLTKIFTGAIVVVSVGFIVLGGSELVVSAGNQETIEKGRKTVTWAIIGLIIALSAFSIVAIIEDLLGVH